MKTASMRIRNGVVVAGPRNGVSTRPVAFRVTDDERALLEGAAARNDVPLGMWLRDLALAAAQKTA